MVHRMTGSQKVLMPGGSGSRYHPCTASSRDGRRLAPTVSPSMGSGWHQVALALPLARITGMRVTPAQKLSAGLKVQSGQLRVHCGFAGTCGRGSAFPFPPQLHYQVVSPRIRNVGAAKGKGNRCNLWFIRRPAVLVRGGHRMVAPRDWERSKRHRHAGAEFLYQRHQLALVGPA